jgi:hypothetical protein
MTAKHLLLATTLLLCLSSSSQAQTIGVVSLTQIKADGTTITRDAATTPSFRFGPRDRRLIHISVNLTAATTEPIGLELDCPNALTISNIAQIGVRTIGASCTVPASARWETYLAMIRISTYDHTAVYDTRVIQWKSQTPGGDSVPR